jgi:ribonuclease Z
MEVTLLGTSCSIPTKERNTAGYFLKLKNEGLLFDCGEGIQRQFKKANLKLPKITAIFLTHWHGDHVLGLPGMLQTLSGVDPPKPITIYGPKGSKKYFEHMSKGLAFELRLPLKIVEVEEGVIYKTKNLTVKALPMKHRIPCVAYRVEEASRRKMDLKKLKELGISGREVGELQKGFSIISKGKKVLPSEVSKKVTGRVFTYITDTTENPNAAKISKDANLLVCECVYEQGMLEKAIKHRHLTTGQVATIASSARVKHLVITHYSARYKEVEHLVKEIQETYSGKVTPGEDFMTIKV